MMATSPGSILIIKPSSFGDVVHTLPAVACLKRAWPQAWLSWLINPEWMPLIEGNPDVDAVLPFPRASFRGLRSLGFFRWCRESLGGLKPDLAVDFQGLLRSAWMGRASRSGGLTGMSDAREGARFLYDKVVTVPTGAVHSVERYLAIAEAVAEEFGGQATPDPLSWWVDRVPTGVPCLPEGSLPERYLLLHPYARGAGKSLSEHQVEAICRLVSPRRVVLVGRKAGKAEARLPENCLDLLNQTSLAHLIWLIRRAAVVVTVDSGPAHLAAALQRPMIAIHTWSDPRRVGPYFDEALVWKNGQLLPMREMSRQTEAFFRKPGLPLRDQDLATVAAAAISLSDSCA